MGVCGSISPNIMVSYAGTLKSFKCKSIAELRLQIIKKMGITTSFFILAEGEVVKTSNELLAHSHKRIVNVEVVLGHEKTTPHKSQIEIRGRNTIAYLSKYLIFPSELFNEKNIHTEKIKIGNEEYQMKPYYHNLDIPGLALGKIKTEKRKIETLVITEEKLDLDANLFIYRKNKKFSAISVNSSLSMIGALVYNQKNVPVGVIAWNERNLIVPLENLKNSIHFAINFANLPNESLALNLSNNASVISYIYTEYSCLCVDNRIITYHPNEYSVKVYPTEKKNLSNYSITQTPIGFILHYQKEVFNFSINSLKSLPESNNLYRKHAALLHQASYVCISGLSTSAVESLNLYSMKWSSLPSLPNAIESASCCSFSSSIYLIGGLYDNQPTDTIWKLERNWEIVKFKLPWTTIGSGAISVGQEMIIFGGEQNDKDKFIVFENGKEVSQGSLGAHASFQGLQCGRVNFDIVIFSREGQIFKYDTTLKRFLLCSIGNYFID